jgi:hypothetical protein
LQGDHTSIKYRSIVLRPVVKAAAADDESSRLLLGFEADEVAQVIERLSQEKLEITRTAERSADGA